MLLALGYTIGTNAAPIRVHYPEGTVHGFVILRTLAGQMLAGGELLQSVHNGSVTSRLVLRFTDQSVYDDTTVFSQQDQFRLVSDHVIQKGPAFTEPADVLVDAVKQQVTVHRGRDPQPKTHDLQMPADLSNGLLLILLKNVSRTAVTTVSMIGGTEKPRLVQLAIHPVGTETFQNGPVRAKASHFVLKTEIGGIPGLLARVLGKQPADLHVWMSGDPPTFVKFEGPLYVGGPVWRAELAAPVWVK